MYYSDDPIRDFERKDKDDTDWARKRPKCCYCGEPILETRAYCYDGDWYCMECSGELVERVQDECFMEVPDLMED